MGIKKVDKFIVQLTGFNLFTHLQTKHNWTDEDTFDFMNKNNQDTSFYEEYKTTKEDLIKERKSQRESLINGYSLNDSCVLAVSKSADVTPQEAIELIIDEDWICLTNEEADKMSRDYILDSVWAFNSSFLSCHTGINEDVFEALQDKCEEVNDIILNSIKDKKHFVEDAISYDGRGHFITSYDGEEHEQYINKEFRYCYRMK